MTWRYFARFVHGKCQTTIRFKSNDTRSGERRDKLARVRERYIQREEDILSIYVYVRHAIVYNAIQKIHLVSIGTMGQQYAAGSSSIKYPFSYKRLRTNTYNYKTFNEPDRSSTRKMLF